MKPVERFNVFDVDGEVFLEDHENGSYHIGGIDDVDMPCLNDIAYLLNKQSKRIGVLEYELATLDGLYVSDMGDMSEPFRLDFSDVLSE